MRTKIASSTTNNECVCLETEIRTHLLSLTHMLQVLPSHIGRLRGEIDF